MFPLEVPASSAKLSPKTCIEDELLIHKAILGDETAYGDLYRRHVQSVSKVAIRITRNLEDAEDAIQDTFSSAFRHLGSFDRRAQFSTWLTRIAINSALMVIRKRARRLELSIDSYDEDESFSPIQVEDMRPNPETIYIKGEGISQLKLAVQHLPSLLREVTELRCSDDLPLRQIAQMTGISLAATKSRLLRAGTKLHKKLASDRKRYSHIQHRSTAK